MEVNMPMVKMCDASVCAYNKDNMCHAMAITVGGPMPMCDTAMESMEKGGMDGMTAGVGACKVMSCMHNKSLECTAEMVNMKFHMNHCECDTFKSM